MRMAFLGACALTVSGCSGSNILYLHSESDAKAAGEAIVALDQTKTKHLAYILGERAFLDLAHDEDVDLIVSRELALRDASIIELLNAPSKMTKIIFERSMELFGDGQAIQQERVKIGLDTGLVATLC